jgi:hypothetical protein
MRSAGPPPSWTICELTWELGTIGDGWGYLLAGFEVTRLFPHYTSDVIHGTCKFDMRVRALCLGEGGGGVIGSMHSLCRYDVV